MNLMGHLYKRERGINKGICFVQRPKSSRYCRQPLLNNLSASIALSFIASGKSSRIRHIWKTCAQTSNFNSFNRVFSDIHVDRPSSSELVGFLSRVWAADMRTRTMHYHPDSDSSSMCKKKNGMLIIKFYRETAASK